MKKANNVRAKFMYGVYRGKRGIYHCVNVATFEIIVFPRATGRR